MIPFIFSLRFITGAVVGGASVWFFKSQLATWGSWVYQHVKAKFAKKQ